MSVHHLYRLSMNALLDVSDLLEDPDFCIPLTCVRNTQMVGDNGLATFTPTRYEFLGVVTQDKGRSLARGDASGTQSGSITVTAQFRLTAGNAQFAADMVEWSGRLWTVMHVNDYSNYGNGFVSATCDLLPVSGGAQQQTPDEAPLRGNVDA